MSNIPGATNISVTAGQPGGNLQSGLASSGPVTEAELKAKAKGKRVTLEDVEGCIASEHFFRSGDAAFAGVMDPIPDRTYAQLQCLTFCVLVLDNGYTVTGQSACADPANYNEEIGRRLAREDAVKKIWPLLGFALRDDLYYKKKMLDERAFTEGPDFGVYIGTKVVHAIPMSRAVYNDFRGWVMPADEEDDEGYLVQYTDSLNGNVPDWLGYISWSPKDVFERAYRAVDDEAVSASEPRQAAEGEGAGENGPQTQAPKKEETFIDRLKVEREQLNERVEKLGEFLQSDRYTYLSWVEQTDLLNQYHYMVGYLNVLDGRLTRMTAIN